MSTDIGTQARRLREYAEGQLRAYDPQDDVNVVGHGGSLVAFGAVLTVLTLTARARGQRLPAGYDLSDIALGGLATYQFSRLLGKGSVTSPIRAPFTQFEKAAGSSEHVESPRDDGRVRHTVGELLTCPFCLAQWVGTAYVAGLATAPRVARTWAALFSVTAIANAGQHVYARLRAD